MTVEEVIKVLKQLPPHAEVYGWDDGTVCVTSNEVSVYLNPNSGVVGLFDKESGWKPTGKFTDGKKLTVQE